MANAMFSEPGFWSWLGLLIYVIWLHYQQNTRHRGIDVEDVDHNKSDSFGEYMSGQADISVHHGAELQRVRESLLELAADINRIESAVCTLSGWPGPTDRVSNKAFERHSELPGELPKDIRDDYLAASWTCPNCGSRVPHNWIWWCKQCQRRTFPPVAGIEIYPPTDYDPTQSCGGRFEFNSNEEPPSPNQTKRAAK